jgi:proline iminopeptidase
MPLPLVVLACVGLLVIAGALAYFWYAYRRYHAVPLTPRPCQTTAECVQVDGFDLHLRELGSQHGGVPVVVLHGGPGHSSLSFKDGLDFLAEQRRVVLYDQRGSGLSEVKPGADNYSVEALVEELDILRRDVLEAEQIDLIGHSAGGALAQRYTLEHPTNVRRLVLVGSTAVNNNMSHATLWHLLGPALYATAMGMPPSHSGQADAWFQSDQLEADTRRLFDPTDSKPIQDTGPSTFATWFAVSQSFAGGDKAAQLKELQTPTLVLFGEADTPYTGARNATRLTTLLPHARSICISRSGHWPFLENPEEFQHVVGEFLFDGDSPIPS